MRSAMENMLFAKLIHSIDPFIIIPIYDRKNEYEYFRFMRKIADFTRITLSFDLLNDFLQQSYSEIELITKTEGITSTEIETMRFLESNEKYLAISVEMINSRTEENVSR